MSQEKPRRPEHEPIKYGDLFNVSGGLASKPIRPRDAATVQSAENQTLGQTRQDGPAALMSSAAAKNETAGFVSHDAVTNIARNEGVAMSVTNESGNNRRVVTETLGGQVLGEFVEDADAAKGTRTGDALGSTVDDEVVPDAASAQAPQVGATGDYDFISNQVGAGAATLNPRLSGNQDENALPNDSMSKPVSRENPEIINSVPGGMGASMATADRVKKNK